MKTTYLLGILIVIATSLGNAQPLKQNLDKIKSFIKEISADKSTINQKWEYDPKDNTSITLNIVTTDSKGKSSEEIYKFNLGFFDKNLVKRVTSDKVMKIELQAAQSLKMVEYTKNGEKQGYQNEITLFNDNIDDARELEKLLKETIPLAKETWEKSIKLPEELNALQKWFEQSPKEVNDLTQQSFKNTSAYKDRVACTLESSDGKKATETQTEWSWGDLNENSVAIKISGKACAIEVQTQNKNEFVRKIQNGLIKGYERSIELLANNPNQAKTMALAIQKIIPLARKELQSRTPKPQSPDEAYKILKSALQDFVVNENEYKQQINLTCTTQYTLVTSLKSKSKSEIYSFNFGDLAAPKLECKEAVGVEIGTLENKKYIGLTSNDQQQNYTNNLTLYTADIENARYLMAALPVLAQACKQNPKTENTAWLADKLKNANLAGMSQELTQQEASTPCKWVFTTTETSSKKSVVSTYEFNLYDLELRSISLDVSGKLLYLSAKTINNEKFIRITKDGKAGFTNEVNMILDNLDDAKKAVATLKALVETCKK